MRMSADIEAAASMKHLDGTTTFEDGVMAYKQLTQEQQYAVRKARKCSWGTTLQHLKVKALHKQR